jgi:hypothetical protein
MVTSAPAFLFHVLVLLVVSFFLRSFMVLLARLGQFPRPLKDSFLSNLFGILQPIDTMPAA